MRSSGSPGPAPTRLTLPGVFGLLAGALFTGIVATLGGGFVWENGAHFAFFNFFGIAGEDLYEGPTTPDLEWPTWIVYSAIPLGSSLMCFRFLQVTWAFLKTGELPHHDHGHVDDLLTIGSNAAALESWNVSAGTGIDRVDYGAVTNAYNLLLDLSVGQAEVRNAVGGALAQRQTISGFDAAVAGAGNDTLIGMANVGNLMDGGLGSDRAVYTGEVRALTFDMTAPGANREMQAFVNGYTVWGTDTLNSIEHLIGGDSDGWIVTMAFNIHVENIFPQGIAGWARFQTAHRDTGSRQGLQQFMQGTGTIWRRHDQRGLVTAGQAGIVLAQHQKTRGVVGRFRGSYPTTFWPPQRVIAKRWRKRRHRPIS